jgi:O-antigen/teichoic acid export membrane protein
MQRVKQTLPRPTGKRLGAGSLATVGGRISNAASQLLITGLLARTLEPSAFGLWALLYTVYNLVPSLDLGLGQALRLKLAELNARGGHDQLEQQLFSSVLIALILWGLALAGIAAVVVSLLPGWDIGLKTLVVFFAVVCGLTTALNLGTQVFYAYEEGFERGIADVIQALVLAGAVWSAAGSRNFERVTYTFFSAAALVGGGILLWFVQRRGWAIKLPRVPEIVTTLQMLWRSSLWFWLLGLFAIGLLNTALLFVAGLGNLEQVGHFTILQRLFMLLITLHLAWLAPLQSAYTRAASLEDWAWVGKTWLRSVNLTLVGVGAASIILVIAHHDLVLLWTGKSLYEPLLVLMLAVWACVWAWVNANSVVLNGIGILKPQVMLLGMGLLFYASASTFLISLVGVGGVIASALIAVLPLAFLSPRWIRKQIYKES